MGTLKKVLFQLIFIGLVFVAGYVVNDIHRSYLIRAQSHFKARFIDIPYFKFVAEEALQRSPGFRDDPSVSYLVAQGMLPEYSSHYVSPITVGALLPPKVYKINAKSNCVLAEDRTMLVTHFGASDYFIERKADKLVVGSKHHLDLAESVAFNE